MATTPITINIDSTLITEAITALCFQGGYQTQIPEPANPGSFIANPQTQGTFAKQMVINYVKNIIVEQRRRNANAAVVAIDSSLIS